MDQQSAHLHLVAPNPSTGLGDVADDDLMLLVQRGHIQAFAALVARHHALVLGYACRFLGDRAAGEEVGQEVFGALWAERERFEARGRFRSYLLTMAFNRCHVAARQRTRQRKKLENLALLAAPPSGETLPVDRLLATARAEELRQNLAELPEHLRQALILRYLHDLSLKEVAAVLKIPLGTVKANVFRGLKRLYAAMTGGTL